MKKIALATTALFILSAGAASAADLAARPYTKAPVAVPVFSWTGCYVGAQVGWQGKSDHTREYFTATGAYNGFDQGFDTSGVVGGGHAGCNYQMNNFVIGLEGDIEGADVTGGYRLANGNGTDFSVRWQGSIRGRAGVAFDRVLLYVTGGAAFADLRYTYFTPLVRESFTNGVTGWTAGVGVEYALNQNWSVRGEYRFTDYGSVTNNSLVAFPGFTYRHDPEFHQARVGVSYRFGGPVVAKY